MRLILLLLLSIQLFSQTKKLDTVFCDCAQAKIIPVNSKTIYGKTIKPNGFGVIKEISPTKQKTKFAFEEEHNSAWYKLMINTNGELTLDIIPTKADDDYDFMLFKASKNNFCDSLQKHKINPIRACISRDKEELNGKTGLNYKSTKELVKHGVGEAYCKNLSVKKGEIYYLVLDNVHEKGDGHKIELCISIPTRISGTIVDENNKPVIAEITLTNKKGDTISVEQTNNEGSYSFQAPIVKNEDYSLNFYNDSSFTFTKSFRSTDTLAIQKLQTVLHKLKKGKKYSVGSINFVPASVLNLPQAIPSMYNLYRLILKNKNLKIKIIVHQNGQTSSQKKDVEFTIGRANTIKNYLISKGIDSLRIETDGKGGREMLFPLPNKSEEQAQQNRRVEIMVLEF